MELIERDARHAKRAAAGFARRRQMRGAAVGHPVPARPRQPAFRRDDDARTVAGPAPERARDETLVVSDLGLVETVRVGCIE